MPAFADQDPDKTTKGTEANIQTPQVGPPPSLEPAPTQAATPVLQPTAEKAAPVVSHWAEQGPKAEEDAKKKPPVNDPGFEQIIGQNLQEGKAPDQITLPKALTDGMQAGWDKSLPLGQAREQGGNLVRNKDGSFAYRHGKSVSGDFFSPDYSDVGKDQSLVGVGHTHPYSQDEGGFTDVSFSGGDLSSIVYETQPLNIVQSGETLFIVARTVEFEKLLEGKDREEKKKLAAQIEAVWDKVYQGTKGKIPERAEAATRATCHAFHLVYYRGKGSTLARVDTSESTKVKEQK